MFPNVKTLYLYIESEQLVNQYEELQARYPQIKLEVSMLPVNRAPLNIATNEYFAGMQLFINN